MGPTARKYGGILFHIFLATYMFMGLAIVCDNYFVPALDRIADGEKDMLHPLVPVLASPMCL